MNYLFQRRVSPLGLTLVLCLIAALAFAQKTGKRADDARRHTADAAKAFNEIMDAPDNGIPKELVDKAQAIAVFPGS
jgi:lipid-binding SYLF domain-containing protein